MITLSICQNKAFGKYCWVYRGASLDHANWFRVMAYGNITWGRRGHLYIVYTIWSFGQEFILFQQALCLLSK